MKKDKILHLTIAFVIITVSLSAIELDKVCHFTGSYIIYDVTYNLLDKETHKCELIALGTALSIGIGKEVYDEYFSTEDLLYDISGILTAMVFNKVYLKLSKNKALIGFKF